MGQSHRLPHCIYIGDANGLRDDILYQVGKSNLLKRIPEKIS